MAQLPSVIDQYIAGFLCYLNYIYRFMVIGIFASQLNVSIAKLPN